MNKQNRNRLRDSENRLTIARKEGVEGVEKVKGLRSTDAELQNSHGDVKSSIGNRVNKVITVYGVRWALDISEITV